MRPGGSSGPGPGTWCAGKHSSGCLLQRTDRSLDSGHLLVEMPAVVDIFLGQLEEPFSLGRVGAGEHGVAPFLQGEFLERRGRLAAVEMERLGPVMGRAGVVAIERPVA